MKAIFILILLFSFKLSFARLEMSFHPNPPVMGQELQLIIRQYDKNATTLPDFSSLNQDFRIMGTQQSVSYQLINGQSHRENMWTLMLMPKHDGKISIPELTIGDEKTKGLEIEIQKYQTQVHQERNGDATTFLDWHFSLERPVVHEQVNLSLKIYHLQPLLDAKLQPPSVKNGLLFSLEQALRYFEVKRGIRYEVEEYRYVIYPQKSGKIEITPPVLDAIEYDLVPTPVHVSLNALSLLVEPPPNGQNTTTWLPAQKLKYKDLKPLSGKIGIPVGDTLVRQLQITAIGLPAQLIPDLDVSCGDGCKVYMNPAKISNKMENTTLYGRKTYDITYLFSKEGEKNIPEIQIPWFNTSTRHLEILTIPGMRVDIFADKKNKQDLEVSSQANHVNYIHPWLFAILGFLGGSLLMQFLSKCPWQKTLKQLREFEFEHYALKKACLNHDAEKVRLEILVWAKKAGFHKTIFDLHDIIAEIQPSDFRDELQALIAYLYSYKQPKRWHGLRFWRAFKAFKLKQNKVETSPPQTLKLNP